MCNISLFFAFPLRQVIAIKERFSIECLKPKHLQWPITRNSTKKGKSTNQNSDQIQDQMAIGFK